MQVHHMFFTPKSSYYAHIAKLLLHQTTFATEYVYTSNLVHRRTFTPENLEHKGHFKPKNFYRRRLVQQNPFAPVNLFYRPEQNPNHNRTSSIEWGVLLHQKTFTPEGTRNLLRQRAVTARHCTPKTILSSYLQQPSSAAILNSHSQQHSTYCMSSCCCWGWWSSM